MRTLNLYLFATLCVPTLLVGPEVPWPLPSLYGHVPVVLPQEGRR